MFPFYAVSLFMAVLTLVWWRRQNGTRRFLAVLGGIALLWAVGMSLTLLPAPYAAWWSVGGAIAAGMGLAWGARLSWRWSVALAGGVALLALWPAAPVEALLRWGMVVAVPFTAVSLAARLPSSSEGDSDFSDKVPTDHIAYPVLARLEQGILLRDERGTIRFANAAAARLLDVTPEALAEKPLQDAPLPAVDEGVTRFERNGRVVQAQSISLSSDTPDVTQVVVLNDVTARYRAEQSRDQFLTTISHELRSPLTVIKGYTELLRTGAAGELTLRQADFAGQVQHQADHLVDLINGLIFASSVRGGRLEYTGGLTDLDQIMRQMARELETRAAAQGVTIRVDVGEELNPIQADPIHIAMVVKELLRNAIKYSHRGGTVMARARLQAEAEQSFVVVSVADEGIGIDPAQQAYIFETFLRSDRSDTEVRAGGMGLGLPIVRALVEAYNGRIWFESTPEQGSTFFFLVPTEQPGVTVLPTPPARPAIEGRG